MRAKCSQSKMGDLNPSRRPEVAEKIRQHHIDSGRFNGSRHPCAKPIGYEHLNTQGRWLIIVSDEDVARFGYTSRQVFRAVHTWNTSHPNDPVRKGEIVHHEDENTENDAPDNLKKKTQSEHMRDHLRDPRMKAAIAESNRRRAKLPA